MTQNEASIAKYRLCAVGYDDSAQATMALRQRTIALLQLRPGDVVLDVGAGTGLSYAMLRDGVGAGAHGQPSQGHTQGCAPGRVLAFEQSPDMFAQAQVRLLREGWMDDGSVWHTCAAAESVQLPAQPDAILFNFTHDILRSPAAVSNIVRQAKPGARVAVAGMKFFPWWTGPLNLLAWLKNRPYNVRAADLWAPWDILETRCQTLKRESVLWGMAYMAQGRLR